jgi:hypothetical protein
MTRLAAGELGAALGSGDDFLEDVLKAERDARRVRSREILTRTAGFPALKTLEAYDFTFATGGPSGAMAPQSSRAWGPKTGHPGTQTRTRCLARAVHGLLDRFHCDRGLTLMLKSRLTIRPADARYLSNGRCGAADARP